MQQAMQMNSLSLAYIGDAVHSLFVRERLVVNHYTKAGELHKMASATVNAHEQAVLADKLWEQFTQEEQTVFLRGRNGKAHHKAKNQSGADYRKATGLEAVLGFLYITGQHQRIVELLEEGHGVHGVHFVQ